MSIYAHTPMCTCTAAEIWKRIFFSLLGKAFFIIYFTGMTDVCTCISEIWILVPAFTGQVTNCVNLMNMCFNVKENSSVRRMMNTNSLILRSPVQCNVVGQSDIQVVELPEWE